MRTKWPQRGLEEEAEAGARRPEVPELVFEGVTGCHVEKGYHFFFFLPRAYLKRHSTVQTKNFLIIRIILNLE